ncbi:DUF1330 domain-containing protein [uncultured Sneathiella sp.]|jgi:uncharacterized protein (DUF1330 family)|uniref:DUF1330 domain-containing protein n=1 Tax=uncultured Sneathiella sp. TaxID=879315 RepID=UPI0030D992A7|tara:strand:- start:6942 stop:7244 length:303 start_codon:yes stop_codon:yes gene_type:complete
MAAYVIARITVKDPEQYEVYKSLAPIAIKKYGGQYLTRGGAMETIEGPEETQRMVILQFPDMASARAFYDSPEYSKARDARKNAADGQFVLLEGLDAPLW